ncbi:MAG: hypothetical protein MPK09_00040 [Gammaproteobacteria bacterium]|nr:hypothetical protein [Gammaproteobacteria bacterium]
MLKTDFEKTFHECVISVDPKYVFPYAGKTYVVLGADLVYENYNFRGKGENCDEYIFFDYTSKMTGIYLVERKDNEASKSVKVEKIHDQLQGGADFIADFIEKDHSRAVFQFDFRPVLVSRTIRIGLNNRLKLKTICLHGRKKRILHAEIGKKTKFPPLENK